jgi:hypothetical protein
MWVQNVVVCATAAEATLCVWVEVVSNICFYQLEAPRATLRYNIAVLSTFKQQAISKHIEAEIPDMANQPRSTMSQHATPPPSTLKPKSSNVIHNPHL